MHPRLAVIKSVPMDQSGHRNGSTPPDELTGVLGDAEEGEVTLVLRVRLDAAGRLVGSVLLPGRDPVGFTGWLELMSEVSRNVPIGNPRLS